MKEIQLENKDYELRINKDVISFRLKELSNTGFNALSVFYHSFNGDLSKFLKYSLQSIKRAANSRNVIFEKEHEELFLTEWEQAILRGGFAPDVLHAELRMAIMREDKELISRLILIKGIPVDSFNNLAITICDYYGKDEIKKYLTRL